MMSEPRMPIGMFFWGSRVSSATVDDDGVVLDVRKENDCSCRADAPEAVRRERRVVGRVDVREPDHDKEDEDQDLDADHHRVEPRALADAVDQQHGQHRDDERAEKVEHDVVAAQCRCGVPRHRAFGDGLGVGPVVGRHPRGEVEPAESKECLQIGRPRDGDADVADGVLDDQVPADDPCDDLAERGVGVRVGRPADRYHGRELGVAKRGERTDDGGDDERERKRGTGAGAGHVARRSRSHGAEDSGADDGADAEHDDVRCAERPAEGHLGLFGILQNGVQVLGAQNSKCHAGLQLSRGTKDAGLWVCGFGGVKDVIRKRRATNGGSHAKAQRCQGRKATLSSNPSRLCTFAPLRVMSFY